MKQTFTFYGADSKGKMAIAVVEFDIIARGCSQAELEESIQCRGNSMLNQTLLSIGASELNYNQRGFEGQMRVIFPFFEDKPDKFTITSITLKSLRIRG